ncbi:hypothetical protein VPHD479_0010 [Vibrio phage D479]
MSVQQATKFENVLSLNCINTAAFEARVEDVNKIAKRLGLDPITFTYGEITSVVKQGVHGKYKEHFVEVTITGEYPTYNGWSFVTLLDHEEGLVRSFGETNHRHLIGDTTCHHCNTKRSRSKTFVITNDDKEMQVGGACLKYYINTKTTNSLTSFYSAFDAFFDDYPMGGGYAANPVFLVEDTIKWCWVDVQERGYKGTHSELSTRRVVSGILNPPAGDYGKEDRARRDDYTARYDLEQAEKEAAKIIDWVKALEPKTDFEHNIKACIERGFVSSKGFGFTCAAIVAYNKAQDNDILAKKKVKEVLVSNYIGTIKKREEFELTLEHVFVSEGYYGDTYIHKFTDLNGNVVTWFGTKRLSHKDGSAVGVTDTVKVKATVKEHAEYKDVKQTVVQRVTVA